MIKSINIVVLLLISPIALLALTDKELAVSIDLAGKQRMLSQKMTKESFLINADIEKKKNMEALTKSSQLFDKILNGLMNGDGSLKLVAIKNSEVQTQLKNVQTRWNPFYALLKKVVSGEADKNIFKTLEEENLKLLKEMNMAVTLYASQTKGNKKMLLANDINLAGKQRMLTQKMAKDLLFISQGLNKDFYLKDFKASRKLFTMTLDGLFNGDKKLKLKGIKLPKIKTQLKVVEKLWKDEQIQLDNALKNKGVDKAVTGLDTILLEMNKGVELYTQSVNRQKQKFKLSSIVGDFMNKTKILKKRINLSGKQRMLTQRMAKLALLVESNIDKKENLEKLITFSELYSKTLNAFKKGDKDLGCIATNDTAVKEQILVLEKEWESFYDEVKNIIKGEDKEGKALAYVIANNESLLKSSNKLVIEYEKSNRSKNYLDIARLHIINIAGRQRMLTQKMTKEKLLVIKGEKAYEQKLKATITLFDTSLIALIEGDKEQHIVKSSNDKIKKQLGLVLDMWTKLKPLYEKSKLNKKELETIIKENSLLLKEMNHMVKMAEVELEY